MAERFNIQYSKVPLDIYTKCDECNFTGVVIFSYWDLLLFHVAKYVCYLIEIVK